jgi:Protein of unknown function (DUF3617)
MAKRMLAVGPIAGILVHYNVSRRAIQVCRSRAEKLMTRVAILLTAATAAMAVTFTARAQSIDLPPRKPGLWDMKMATEKPAGGPGFGAQMCIDAATDKDLMNFGLKMSKDSCKRYDVKRTGGTWLIDADCTFGPVKSVTKTTISGDFQSSITVRVEGTTEGIPGAGSGPQQTLITQTAKWTGACGEGMRPGDIILGGGIKMNIKQVKELQKMMPNLQIK